jgi:DNA-binding NarL/FixJ family response regulator
MFDADEAIDVLEQRRDIELVITDINMPGSMNGLRLAAAIRDRWPPIGRRGDRSFCPKRADDKHAEGGRLARPIPAGFREQVRAVVSPMTGGFLASPAARRLDSRSGASARNASSHLDLSYVGHRAISAGGAAIGLAVWRAERAKAGGIVAAEPEPEQRAW